MSADSDVRSQKIINFLHGYFDSLMDCANDIHSVGTVVRCLVNLGENAQEDTMLILIRDRWLKIYPGEEPLKIEEFVNCIDSVDNHIGHRLYEDYKKIQAEQQKASLKIVRGGSLRVNSADVGSVDSRRRELRLHVIEGRASLENIDDVIHEYDF